MSETRERPSLCVSIDVECDMPRWVVEPETTVENIKGIPRLQALFDEVGARPTYLVTYPVASTPWCVEIFKPLLEAGRCEIGMHCHPWTTPPIGEAERLTASFLSNMAPSVVEQKLAAITARIRDAFGVAPVSYRAGRFGISPSQVPVLEDLGYKVDSSVTPLVSWADQGGPDFRDAPARPYHPSYLDVRREGNARLLEVPVTISLNRVVPEWARWLYLRIPRVTRLRGLLSRDRLDLLDLVWAYPAEFGAREMIQAGDVAERTGAPVVNVFMHSNEVWPGGSPYCTSERELEAYLGRFREALEELIGARGFVPRTLREFCEEHSC
jgi:hypothetical protein